MVLFLVVVGFGWLLCVGVGFVVSIWSWIFGVFGFDLVNGFFLVVFWVFFVLFLRCWLDCDFVGLFILLCGWVPCFVFYYGCLVGCLVIFFWRIVVAWVFDLLSCFRSE